jgi:hypothetical protein
MCERSHDHEQISLNSNVCGMLYANQALKEGQRFYGRTWTSLQSGKTGIGPFSRVKGWPRVIYHRAGVVNCMVDLCT